MLTQLATMPREQILEFLQKLTAAAPVRHPTAAPRFHLIEIPQARPSRDA